MHGCLHTGPLADANVVRNAIRKDNALRGPSRSYETIFRFVRADIEEALVDKLQTQVGYRSF